MGKKQIFNTLLALLILLTTRTSTFANGDLQDSNIDAPESEIDIQIENTETDYENSDEYGIINPFDIKIKIGTQNPLTKRIPLIVTVTPNIDTERVEITWDSRYGLDFSNSFAQYLKLEKDLPYEFKSTLIPEEPGSYTLTVNVTEWSYGKNYTSSEDVSLTLSENLVATPPTEGYGIAQLIMLLGLLVAFVVFIFLLIILGKKAMAWLKDWLKPPQV